MSEISRVQGKDIPDDVQVKPGDVVPGNVVYSKVNKNFHKIEASVTLGRTATVNIRSETGVNANGDGSGASHTLWVDGAQKDQALAQDGFNAWNGVVATTMVFQSGRAYRILAMAQFHDADPINTDLEVRVLTL